VAGPVLIRGGATLYWIGPDGTVVARERLDDDPALAARFVADGYRTVPMERRRRWLESPQGAPIATAEATLRELGAGANRKLPAPPIGAGRSARERLPSRSVAEERAFLLPLARLSAARALSGPGELVIALAREEARLERALGREQGAGAQWVAPESGPLADQAREQLGFQEQFARHHGAVERRLETAARDHLPNLSELLGAKVAARLVAAAGSRGALARMSSSRLQLLGARRRPGKDRGPRFGVIYRAPGLDDLAPSRQGRYARSLAALAVIAVRADHLTHRNLGETLLLRRDRRLAELRRRTK
jgi:hypothetical protein